MVIHDVIPFTYVLVIVLISHFYYTWGLMGSIYQKYVSEIMIKIKNQKKFLIFHIFILQFLDQQAHIANNMTFF